MFILYNLLLSLTLPFWFPVVWLRARRRKAQPIWEERWGNFPIEFDKTAKRIWIHAVSVGEVIAVASVVRLLRERLPNHEIVMSVTTSSGHETAHGQNVKEPGLYDRLVYLPFDLARCMLAAMQRVQPDAVVVMETELWPCLFWAAKVFDARTLLINGRVSDRSYPRARLLKPLYSSVFQNLDQCLMQGEVDAERIRALGAKSAQVFGNCKFDQMSPDQVPDAAEIRAEYGIPSAVPVLVVGSTRGSDEEVFVLTAIAESKVWRDGNLVVIHAPRHLERVAGLCATAHTKLKIQPALRSKRESGRYIVLDTYGDLASAYGAADVVILGGGFSPMGGQNVIQPLALGKPVIHGSHMENFRSAAESARKVGATVTVTSPSELTEALDRLFSEPETRRTMGDAAARLVRESAGASQRYANAIADAVGQSAR